MELLAAQNPGLAPPNTNALLRFTNYSDNIRYSGDVVIAGFSPVGTPTHQSGVTSTNAFVLVALRSGPMPTGARGAWRFNLWRKR